MYKKPEYSIIRFKDLLSDLLELENISTKEFAERVGITPKHMIDILKGRTDLTLNVMSKIAAITDIDIDFIMRVENNYKLYTEIDRYLQKQNLNATEYLQRFNNKELEKRGYVEEMVQGDSFNYLKDIISYLRIFKPEDIDSLSIAGLYSKEDCPKELVALWLEKCYRETKKQTLREKYIKLYIEDLVEFIKEEASLNRINHEKLINKFNDCGIYLVIQQDLSDGKLKGAFKVLWNKPAIYLTTYHKTLADFYFELLHELAHCKTDFNFAKRTTLVSKMSDKDRDEIDIKRDNQALSWMVDEEYYQTVCKSEHYDIEKETKYPKTFIVFRLLKDKKITKNSEIYKKYTTELECK